ncbi:MAG: amino acid adenylation domain-containing protein [Pseudohongiellaceae bacterium]|jgi:amino acid adenylation domain-containing protein
MHSDTQTFETTAVDFDPFTEQGPAIIKSTPSTPAQLEIWSSIMMDAKASCAFNESFTLKFEGALNIPLLALALQQLADRHDALRASFSSDGLSLNICDQLNCELKISTEEQRSLTSTLHDEAHQAFDLLNGPLLRAHLLKQSAQCHFLIFTAHHIICDGWSLGIVISDLSKIYSSLLGNQALSLEPAFSFVDFAQQKSTKEDEEYWLNKFSRDIPDYELTPDKARPQKRTFNAQRLDIDVDVELIKSIKKQAASIGCSLSAYTMAIYFIALSRWSGETSLVVGMPTASQPGIAPDTLVGHCVSTLPIISHVNPEFSLANFITQTSNSILDAFEHQNFTFGELIRQLPIARDPSRIPLLPILFNLDVGIQDEQLKFGALQTHFYSNPRAYENFEQFINLADYGEHFTIECQYNTDLFEEASIKSRIDEYIWLLTQSSFGLEQKINSLELSPINDYETLLSRGLGPTHHWSAEFPEASSSIAQFISYRAQLQPQATALIFEQQSLSYQQLDTLSSQWANLLLEHQVNVGDRIGLCLDRSPNMLAALLGILKIGASYVPLDPDFPDDRLAYMIKDSGLQHLITQQSQVDHLPEVKYLLCVETLQGKLEQQASTCPEIMIPSQTPAYIIYTSGSTGKPKGVVVPQSSVVNFLHSMAQKPGLTSNDTLLAVTTLSFDIAVLELYLPLWVGATVVIAKKQDSSDARRLLQLLKQHQVTCMQATPATWRLLLSSGWKGKPQIKALCGGEALPQDLATELLSCCSSLWNMYGPTETTVWSTCAQITQTASAPSLGEAIANTQLYVLDEYQRPAPNGIAGELYIGGEGLSLGYNLRDDLSLAAFISNPFGTGKLYRTGDKVRYTFDGSLEYLGRLDQQVKVRGFRIELGEIETLLRQHPNVEDCALSVREVRAGDSRLMAYIVWHGEALTMTDIRTFLRQQLPPYMIPQNIESLEALPRTLNNKLDRKALQQRPLSNDGQQHGIEVIAASTTEELKLLSIWQAILSHKISSIKENFFDLGGHSLLIAQILYRVEQEFTVQLKFSDIYDFPSIEALAKKINQSSTVEKIIITKRPLDAPSLLTLAQQRLWYLNQLEGPNTAYNLPATFRFKGNLNKEALNNSFKDLLNRQDALRYHVIEIDGIPQQRLTPLENFNLDEISLAHILPEKKRELELNKLLLTEQSQLFDLETGALFKAKLIIMSANECLLFFMPHHIIFDGWSFDIFLHEISNRYTYYCGKADTALPQLDFQLDDYAFFARQSQTEVLIEPQIQYWIDHLQDAPTLDMPLDFSRPDIQDVAGDQITFNIPEPLLARLNDIALKEEVSLFMVLMASYCTVLLKYTGQEDLIVATPMADRTKPGTENLIGFFVNALVLRFQLQRSMPFNELLQQVKKNCLEGFDHKDAPFEKIVERLNPERDMSRAPLYQTSITYQDISKRELLMGSDEHTVDIIQTEIPAHDSPLDLNIWFKKHGKKLTGAIVYSTSLFHATTMEQLKDRFIETLKSISLNHHQNLENIDLLDEQARSLLNKQGLGPTHHWSAEFPEASSSIAQFISYRAQLQPQATALIFEQQSLSYQQLDTLSSQWANLLLEHQVNVGDRIGLCLDRSPNMLAALLGILKIGASYVPLDPDFPDDRLAYMIKDSGLQHLITQQSQVDHLPEVKYLLCVETLQGKLEQQASTCPEIMIPSQTPAYIIYTSGSTGKPKGVVVPQSSVVNFLHSMAQKPGLTSNDTLLAVTTLSFDIAVLELYLPLWVGATVVIAKKQDSSDARRLLQLLKQHQVTCMQATPATWRLLLSSGWKGKPQIKALCGGEALPQDLATELLSCCSSLWNMYGPTETTVWSTCAQITQTASAPSLGEAIANTQLYVLDEYQRPAPNGIAGELYIGGEGLSLGYNLRDDLSLAAFISNPFGTGKLYRTGDKVRYTFDGSLEYLGRLDQQVKVRGFRIELGEIETLLRQHPNVEDCALSVREVRAGDSRLMAYIVWHGEALTMTDIRTFLRQQLPPYMIPQNIESLEALPRTLNNKLDRKALQNRQLSNSPVQSIQPPETKNEIWLATLWQEFTGCETISRHDNFFDIGGHSLLSIQVIHKIFETYKVELKPRDMLLENLNQLALKLPLDKQTIKTDPMPDAQSEQINTNIANPKKKTLNARFKRLIGKS